MQTFKKEILAALTLLVAVNVKSTSLAFFWMVFHDERLKEMH